MKKNEEHFSYCLVLPCFFLELLLLPINICEIFVLLSHSVSLIWS